MELHMLRGDRVLNRSGMAERKVHHRAGFTLIELLVVLAVLALLASIVTPMYLDRIDEARETVLRQNLLGLRQSIDQFYRDKGRYPTRLAELVEQRYIRALPQDPITQQTDSWVVLPEKPGQADSVFDVKSGAVGRAKDGTEFNQW
jgi:general secretion pathway protein G